MARTLASVARTPAPVTRLLTAARIPLDRALLVPTGFLRTVRNRNPNASVGHSAYAMNRVVLRGIACAPNSDIHLFLLRKIVSLSVVA